MQKPDIEAQLRDAKAGDLLLFYRARGINRIITAFSRSRYYHVGMYAGDCYVVESRPRGVVKRNWRLPGGGHYFRVIPAPGGAEVGKQERSWFGSFRPVMSLNTTPSATSNSFLSSKVFSCLS